MPKDYYTILGVTKDANEGEIKKAYRQRARVLHPDVNKAPEALMDFQELQQAYETLKDPEKKERYDRGEEVPEYIPPEPPPSYYRRRAWNTYTKYDPENSYPDTDYAHYSKLNTLIGIVTLLFATSFLVDFLFTTTLNNQAVVTVQNKGLLTKKVNDLDYLIIKTQDTEFEKQLSNPELVPGDSIDLKRSLVYGFMQYKKIDQSNFKRMNSSPIITYVLAVIVYIASLNAIMNRKHPERKFNAGIIAGFFSIVLLAFALFG